MQHRTIAEVMTRGVVTASPGTSFKKIAQLLRNNDITAVPVVDDAGRPVGLVSEADLLRKAASLPDPEGRPLGLLLDRDELARADAETAGTMMTTPVVTARPGWSIVETARTMYHHKVKRLPVVDETGKLVGIVSRYDLLQPYLRGDGAISDEIHHDILDAALNLAPDSVHVTVHEGVVTLTGRVETRTLIPVVERLCRSVDGVVTVHQSLDYVHDDLGPSPAAPRVRAATGSSHETSADRG